MKIVRTIAISALVATTLAQPDFCEKGQGNGACQRDGSQYEYSDTVSGSVRTVVSNNCPNHWNVDFNPNVAAPKRFEMRVPSRPNLILMEKDIPPANYLHKQGGAIGVLRNGAQVYSAYPGGNGLKMRGGEFPNDYDKSAQALEGYSFDYCGGHSAKQGDYHAHVPPSCLLRQLKQADDAQSDIVGWAADGFPIYGPRGPGGVMMKRCSEGTADPHLCLDKCGGFHDKDDEFGDGYDYKYFMMGPYEKYDAVNKGGGCSNSLWRGSGSYGQFSDCNYDFVESYYPFSPICFRGCVKGSVGYSDAASPAQCNDVKGLKKEHENDIEITDDMKTYTKMRTNCADEACTNGGDFGECDQNGEGW